MQPIIKIWIEASQGETVQTVEVTSLMTRLINLLDKIESHPFFTNSDQQNLLEESLLNTAELASALNKSESSIHNWKKKSLIPYHRIGRSVFYKKSEVIGALKKIPANQSINPLIFSSRGMSP